MSLGYHDDTESEETEDCVELLEDAEALRDEGVEITRGTNIIKTVCFLMVITRVKLDESPQSSITLGTEEIVVCARCAKALGKSDPAILSGLDFESVSQVGSHTSFPQWEERGGKGNTLKQNNSQSFVPTLIVWVRTAIFFCWTAF